MTTDSDITYFARTDHRSDRRVFGIKQRDRRSHFYVIGKTGTGKSTLLRTMFAQDLATGRSCALLDPHGDLARDVRGLVPPHRCAEVVDLDLPDPDLSWRFNPFANVPRESRSLAAAGLVEVFKKLWPDDWGPRLEHLLRNVVYTLLELQHASFQEIPLLLADRDFREEAVRRLENPAVKDFWINEFEKYSPAFRAVVVAPLQNKVGALLTDPLTRRFLTEPGPILDLRILMDEGRILVVNLDKGRIGEGPAALIGSLLLSSIAVAGIGRSDEREQDRLDFCVYVDEFQTFTTLSLANMLSELRKYRVSMVLANQYLAQLDSDIRDAVFGNVGTLVSFRVGAADAAYLAREFDPVFSPTDLISLPRFSIYVKLMIDGSMSKPFSAATIEYSELAPRRVGA